MTGPSYNIYVWGNKEKNKRAYFCHEESNSVEENGLTHSMNYLMLTEGFPTFICVIQSVGFSSHMKCLMKRKG